MWNRAHSGDISVAMKFSSSLYLPVIYCNHHRKHIMIICAFRRTYNYDMISVMIGADIGQVKRRWGPHSYGLDLYSGKLRPSESIAKLWDLRPPFTCARAIFILAFNRHVKHVLSFNNLSLPVSCHSRESKPLFLSIRLLTDPLLWPMVYEGEK